MTLNDDHTKALRDAAQRVEDAKAAFDAAKANREHLINEAALAGGSYREIAAESGMSYQRVHQLLAGEKPPSMPFNMPLLYHCPRCEAKPGQPCEDRGSTSFHAQRHDRAYTIRMEGSEEPRDDEPGPLTPIYQPHEALTLGALGSGARTQGPVYLNLDDAEAYARTLSKGSYVARWAGRGWERIS